jgi:Ca-activated chloride channel family protein
MAWEERQSHQTRQPCEQGWATARRGPDEITAAGDLRRAAAVTGRTLRLVTDRGCRVALQERRLHCVARQGDAVRYLLALAACLMLLTDMRAQVPVPAAPSEQPAPVGTSGTTPTAGPGQVFRSSVDVVALNVIVTDLRHQFVGGLSSGDFAVFEDGVRQDVSFFAASDLSLDLAILLDTSASMTDKMSIMQRAAMGFANTLRSGDRALIVDIKDATRVLHALGGNKDDIAAAIKSTKASGGTGLFNGLYMTFKELAKARTAAGPDMRRQAIVVLSDGEDTTSLMTFDDVMEVAKQAGIATYTITLRSPELTPFEQSRKSRYFSQAEFSMRQLAQETGGQAYFPLQINELDGVYAAIAKELASQYALGYTPKTPHQDNRYRRIVVQVTDRPEMQIRTRSGYTPNRRTPTGSE